MDKPQKKEILESDKYSSNPAICFGKPYYNQAYDDWEAYHKYDMDSAREEYVEINTIYKRMIVSELEKLPSLWIETLDTKNMNIICKHHVDSLIKKIKGEL